MIAQKNGLNDTVLFSTQNTCFNRITSLTMLVCYSGPEVIVVKSQPKYFFVFFHFKFSYKVFSSLNTFKIANSETLIRQSSLNLY